MKKQTFIYSLLIFISSIGYSQSFVSYLSSKKSYIKVPSGLSLNGSSDIILGSFKLHADTLLCLGGVDLINGKDTFVPVYWKQTEVAGYEQNDSILMIAYDRINKCSVLMEYQFKAGSTTKQLVGDDTIHITSYNTDLGTFSYQRDVQNNICKDLNTTIKSSNNISPLLQNIYSSLPVMVNPDGSFNPSQHAPIDYLTTLNIKEIENYCWESTNRVLISIQDKESVSYPVNALIEAIEHQECEEQGQIILTDNLVNNKWQDITFGTFTFDLKTAGKYISIPSGEYDVTGLDSSGCPFHSEPITIIETEPCEGNSYVFTTAQPQIIEFEKTGEIIIRDRSGQKIVTLNGPCLWDGHDNYGGLLKLGLYIIEFEDGSSKKLKYYH